MVRLKNRYLLVNILYPSRDASKTAGQSDILQFHQPSSPKLDSHVLIRAIRDSVVLHFGDHGSGVITASLAVKYLSPATSTAIIRVARSHWRLVAAALTFINKFPKPVDEACVVRVVRVSGTIRKAEEEAVRRARGAVLLARRQTEELGKGSAFTIGRIMSLSEMSGLRAGRDADEETGEVVERGVGSDLSSEDDEDG